MLLAHHLTQLDDAQRTAAEETEDNNPGDDHPPPRVADAILSPSATGIASETSQPESADNGEQGGESGDTSDGTTVRNFRRTDPTPSPGDIPIESSRVGFTPGNLVFLTESFLDEEPGGTPGDRSSITNMVAEDRAEVGTSIQSNRFPEGIIIVPVMCPGN